MANYQGWNKEELSKSVRGQGGNTSRFHYIAPDVSMRPTSTFTPINHGHIDSSDQTSPLTRTIEPLRTMRNTDIYDFPDDVASLPISSDKKRLNPGAKNNRAATAPSIESSNNAKPENTDSIQLEVSSPKRRKVPVKGSQPAFRAPSRVQTSSISKGLQGLPNCANGDLSVSQLTPPSETLKKPKKRGSSAMVRKRKTSSELIQSSTIAKPSLTYFHSKPPKDIPQSITRLQGFITTEEQLKLKSNGIANTTLQKLASFMYVPRDDNKLDNRSISKQQVKLQKALDEHYGGQIPEEPDHLSSDDRHTSNESFFEEALWVPKQSTNNNELEITCPNPSLTNLIPPEPGLFASEQTSDHLECSPKPSECAPTSSEAMISDNALDHFSRTAVEVQGPQEELLVDMNAVTEIINVNTQSPSEISHVQPVYGQSSTLDIEQDQAQAIYDSILLFPTPRIGGCNTSIPSERPDIENNGSATMNPSRDEFDSDDFGDLDDEDLLALAPCIDSVTHENPVRSHSVKNTAIESSLHSSPEDSFSCAQTIQAGISPTRPQQNFGAAMSSFVIDEDDDFPVDADLEEEMIRLAVASRNEGVVESFVPPLSLRLPSDGYDTDKEVYDNTLQFSSPTSQVSDPSGLRVQSTDVSSPLRSLVTSEEVDWEYVTSAVQISSKDLVIPSTVLSSPLKETTPDKFPSLESSQNNTHIPLDDKHEYLPLAAFARPKFPPLVNDRCPVNGLSSQTILRVCFRIGEMLKEGGRCNALGQDAIVELFARVNFSSRESGTTKQHFQFVDLFHDRPPFAKGILANFKTTGLADSESKVFIESSETLMARCLGRVKKDIRNGNWLIHIVNIRVTDWEEIRWTKRIVCGEFEEKEKTMMSKKS